jgi:hypothetical protein
MDPDPEADPATGLYPGEPLTFDYGAESGIIDEPIVITANSGDEIPPAETAPTMTTTEKKGAGEYLPLLALGFLVLRNLL